MMHDIAYRLPVDSFKGDFGLISARIDIEKYKFGGKVDIKS